MPATTLMSRENKHLIEGIVALYDRVIAQYGDAGRALATGDKALSLSVLENEVKIFADYVSLESDIAFSIARAPVDKNLRRTIAYFSIARDTHHLARYANQLAKFVIALKDKPASSSLRRIQGVYDQAVAAIVAAREIIQKEESKGALDLAKKDNLVDERVTAVREELVASLTSKSGPAEVAERLFVMNVVNALERAGDTVVRICEYVIYIQTGNHTRLL